MIPNDFMQTLLSRVDIVDVIDRLVPLKKAGANYVACCPFHSEKTPVVHGQPDQAVLPLLRLRRARHRDRLPDGIRRQGVSRGGRGTRARRRARGARASSAPGERERREQAHGSQRRSLLDRGEVLPRAAQGRRRARSITSRAAGSPARSPRTSASATRPTPGSRSPAAFAALRRPGARDARASSSRATAASATTASATAIMFPIHDSRGRSSASAGACSATASPSTSTRRRRRSSPRGASSTASFSRATRSATPAASSSSRATWTSSRSPSTASSTRSPRSARRRRRSTSQKLLPPHRLGRVLLRRRHGGPQGGVAGAREYAAGAGRRQERALPVPARRRGSRTITSARAARRRSRR